jgi:hypothetical protein
MFAVVPRTSLRPTQSDAVFTVTTSVEDHFLCRRCENYFESEQTSATMNFNLRIGTYIPISDRTSTNKLYSIISGKYKLVSKTLMGTGKPLSDTS